jgi:3-methyladenine DNA glycosylase/8-oxoguanine DNA glycosylase
MSQTIFIDTPPNFDFKRTVLSHGWCELRPNEFDQENWIFKTVLNSSKPISAKITEAGHQLKIEVQDQIDNLTEAKIKRDVGHIFRFDEDLQDFYRIIKSEKHLGWVIKQKAGRLLRSTTVFEDLIKSICTTNCSWALTKIMVTNLVEKLGETASDGKKCFPTAEAMTRMPEEFFRNEIRSGYRAPYFKELAEKIADGKLEVESWIETEISTKDLKKQMKQVKGVGDYAAENLLKLLGRYDGLALDSWLRGQFYKKYNDGIACDDKQIHTHYERFGHWRGLVIWCEMTEKWM